MGKDVSLVPPSPHFSLVCTIVCGENEFGRACESGWLGEQLFSREGPCVLTINLLGLELGAGSFESGPYIKFHCYHAYPIP